MKDLKVELDEVSNGVTRTVFTTNLEDDYLVQDIILSLVEGYDDDVDCEIIIRTIAESLMEFKQFDKPVLFRYDGYKIHAQQMGECIVASFVSPNPH